MRKSTIKNKGIKHFIVLLFFFSGGESTSTEKSFAVDEEPDLGNLLRSSDISIEDAPVPPFSTPFGRASGGGGIGDGGDKHGDNQHSSTDAVDPGGKSGLEAAPPVIGSSDYRVFPVEGNARQPGLLDSENYPVRKINYREKSGFFSRFFFFQVDSFPPKAPIIPDIFTVAVETIYMKEQKRQVWNLHVDRQEKIVVHKVDLPNNGKRYEWFYSKIVRDFRSGLEFRISNNKEESSNCVVEPISTEFELTSHNLKRFMLEHATLLLNFDPSFVNYWGKV
jgi:hypothetical protein